jgi:hypothetical protein
MIKPMNRESLAPGRSACFLAAIVNSGLEQSGDVSRLECSLPDCRIPLLDDANDKAPEHETAEKPRNKRQNR